MTNGAEYVTIDPGWQQIIQNRKSQFGEKKKLSYPILGVVVKKKPALLGPQTSGVWLWENGIVHWMVLWIICLSWRVPPQATLSCPISVGVFGNFTVLLSKLLMCQVHITSSESYCHEAFSLGPLVVKWELQLDYISYCLLLCSKRISAV